VYPSDDFRCVTLKGRHKRPHELMCRMVKKYGIPLLITADESLKEYLQTVLAQVQGELFTRIAWKV
jgi:nicotinamide riboside kinase